VDNKDNFDIDEELTQSLQRLVEEETNVAKAYVGSNFDESSIQSDVNSNTEDIDINLGTTKMIDSDLIKAKAAMMAAPNHIQSENIDFNDSRNIHENQLLSDKSNQKQGLSKHNKMVIAITCGIVAAALIITVIIAVATNNNKKTDYSYNYEKGMSLYAEGNYIDAVKYLEIAFQTDKGKKDIDTMFYLSEAYKQTGNVDKALEVLEAALSYDKQNERALTALLALCYEHKNGEKINQIIEKYKDSKIKNVLDEYIVAVPTTSETPGSFDEVIELSLFAGDDCTIYYTTDGTTPTVQSTKFSDAIKIEQEALTVKAVAVNEIGVCSEVASFQYTINLKAPDAPILDIEDSEVKIGTIIKVKNLAEGDKAYYTVDGTTPSVNSLPYEDGIELKEGSYMLSVVVINKNKLSSTVTRKNITVRDITEYTYNEALNFLKKRMQELNIIGSNDTFSVGGEMADFVYQAKQEISSIQMYYVRLDKKSASGSKVEGYYGIGVSDGQCYKITGSEGSLSAVVY